MKARRPVRVLRGLAGLLVAVLLVLLVAELLESGPAKPGPFYSVPSSLPKGPPGTLIREEPVPGFYPGTDVYRILYKSTGQNGRATAVSGLVIVPEGSPPRGGRRVVAFAHANVGIDSRCAPSLQREGHAQTIAGLGEFIAEGYVVTASDYQGLGTPGPHPSLVGRVAAMNVLDSVRAARRLRAAHAGSQFALWGLSEGGQAVLFAAQMAASYAPRLHLVGVAAGAPIADLAGFFRDNLQTPVGKVLVAMTLRSWEEVYADAGMEQVVLASERPEVQALAEYCLYGSQYIAEVPAAQALGVSYIGSPPWGTEPWRSILAENTPTGSGITVPVLLTQGEADKIVPPAQTAALAAELCARGQPTDLRLYPTLEDQEAGIVAAPDVAAWIAERFAGRPAPSTCG